MFGWLDAFVSDAPLTYLIVLGLSMADITGLIPAEAVTTAATLLALEGQLLVAGVGVAGAAGVALGDIILYLLGRKVGNRLAPRIFRSDTAKERLHWAERQMDRHGGVIIIAGRFLPMGRTATIFAAGTLELPWQRCALADAVAITIWAGYYVGMPVLLGRSLPGSTWMSLLLSLGIATLVGVLAEAIRRYVLRRRRARQ